MKRYKVFIDNCLKVLKNQELPNNVANFKDLKLNGPGPFT